MLSYADTICIVQCTNAVFKCVLCVNMLQACPMIVLVSVQQYREASLKHVICAYVRMYLLMYACMCACMYVCMHACMYVCMYVCMYICMYVYMHVCIHACIMYACIYVCMYVCMHVCMHVCMYMCTYICMDAHHMHTYVLPAVVFKTLIAGQLIDSNLVVHVIGCNTVGSLVTWCDRALNLGC